MAGNPKKGGTCEQAIVDLPDGMEALKDMLRDAKMQLGKVQLELDVRQAALEIAGKDAGPTRTARPTRRGRRWRRQGTGTGSAGSRPSRAWRRAAAGTRRTPGRGAGPRSTQPPGRPSSPHSRPVGGTCGYGRVAAVVGVGERAVCGIMGEGDLAARPAERKRRYGSYEGEISEAPPNLLRGDGAGTASAPASPASFGQPA